MLCPVCSVPLFCDDSRAVDNGTVVRRRRYCRRCDYRVTTKELTSERLDYLEDRAERYDGLKRMLEGEQNG